MLDSLKEPDIQDPERYGMRTRRLAMLYAHVFLACLAGLAVLIAKLKLYVTLAQRSNVETLTLAFFFVFFLYVGFISLPGFLGALWLLRFRLWALRLAPAEVERRVQTEVNKRRRAHGEGVALNYALERAEAPGQVFQLELRDEAGELGSLRIDGAQIDHVRAPGNTNDLFGYVCYQINDVLRRGPAGQLDIVEWKSLDLEEAEKYLGVVGFTRNLERSLGLKGLWPSLQLDRYHCAELEKRLARVCPAVRREVFLPDWEYSGEHKLPVIPEPLGLISLSRSEKRVDPLGSMTALFTMVLIALLIMLYLIWRPPWVPSA